MAEKNRISLKLTDEQRAAIKEATGKDAEALELAAEELEERIAPGRLFVKVSSAM